MANVKNENAPWLGGWVIGAGMGAAALGVAKVLGGFDWTPAVAIGGVIAAVAGAIMGMPWGAGSKTKAAAAAALAAHDAKAAAPVAAASPPPVPMAEANPAPAAFVQSVAVSAPAPVEAPAAPAKAEAPAALMSMPAAKTESPAKPAVAKAAPKATPKAAAKAAPKAAKPATAADTPAKAAAPKAATKPKAEKAAPTGPVRLKAPRKGKADDLKEIEGIGPAMEKLVNEMGFYHFDQIAGWSDADVALIDGEMKSFKGRITRDKWVAQAKIIVTEGLEAFRERAKTNNY